MMIRNGEVIAWREVPLLAIDALRQTVIDTVAAGGRLVAWCGMDRHDGTVTLLAVLADDASGSLRVAASKIRDSCPSLTPACPQAHYFERELFEQWGIEPQGHPWLKPVRFPPGSGAPAIGCPDWFHIEGEESHEVAVGPIHAGIIEPGHFRFSCHGEQVLHLEISLGYQHRGVERALIGGPSKRTIAYMETVAGDSSVTHALAYCQIVESLAGMTCSEDALRLRGIALELERITNHIGDLGAMAGDVGYLPVASYCGGLRGDVLNLTGMLCGSRLGRGLIRPGGVSFLPDATLLTRLRERLSSGMQAAERAVNLLWHSASVHARFEHTGILDTDTARKLGMVGPAARASGVALDVRRNYPTGIYRRQQMEVGTGKSGDVLDRARQRWVEAEQSARMIDGWLKDMGAPEETTGDDPSEPACTEALTPEALVVSLVEGWRGECCHIAVTDAQGRFRGYKIIDPSFHNWYGLAMVMRDQAILDFPICNKSFNLSYCGHDL